MIFWKLVSVSLLLMIISYQNQVNAMLNITTEAFDLSRKFMLEVEKKFTYADQKDIVNKIKNISELYCSFIAKTKDVESRIRSLYYRLFDNAVPDYLNDMVRNIPDGPWYWDISEEFSWFCHNIIEVINKELYIFPLDTMRYLYGLSTMQKSIHENDYHLYGEDIWKDILNQMNKLLVKVDVESGQSFISVVTNKTQAAKCNEKQSRQRLFFNKVQDTIVTNDAVVYAMMQLSYAHFKIFFDAYNIMKDDMKELIDTETALWAEKDIIKKMKEAERQFIIRNLDTLKTIKATMVFLPRNIWNCNVDHEMQNSEKEEEKDVMSTKLQLRVFQNYIINEVDLNNANTCKEDCPHYSRSKVHGCYDKGICAQQRSCEGILWNCDQNSESAMQICPSKKGKTESRYDYIEIGGKRYGKNKHGYCENSMIEAKTWPRFFFKCSYCTCICENVDVDRYFNLRSVTTDTDLNYVVTGVRFQKHNKIVHIQLQQGKLLENGVIDSTTVEWKPMENHSITDKNVFPGIDYYNISWYDKTICLDELDSPNSSHVLTGIRFKTAFEGSNYMKLEIRVTPLNFKTGKLSDASSYWLSNRAHLSDRKEVNLDKYEVTNLKSDQYLRFSVSPLEVDAGQSTIPYLDAQDVQSIPAVPLTGVGLFLAKDHSIALKGITYDLEPHI